jgi:inner membrane protein
MAPGTHLLISWLSTVEILKDRRERTIVALTGIAPDLDGLGVIVDKITGTTELYLKYHHYLGHSLLSVFILATVAAFLAKSQRVCVWFLSVLVVHAHIICDVAGSKGPDGYQWAVHYLYPFNPEYELTWVHQWELNAWQNHVIMLFLFCVCIFYAKTKKITVLEMFSKKLEQEAFNMYNKYVRRNA